MWNRAVHPRPNSYVLEQLMAQLKPERCSIFYVKGNELFIERESYSVLLGTDEKVERVAKSVEKKKDFSSLKEPYAGIEMSTTITTYASLPLRSGKTLPKCIIELLAVEDIGVHIRRTDYRGGLFKKKDDYSHLLSTEEWLHINPTTEHLLRKKGMN